MITNSQWDKLWQLLLAERSVPKRDTHSCRNFIDALLWLAAHDMNWSSLPRQYGKWRGVYYRARRWQKNGVLNHLINSFMGDGEMKEVVLAMKRARAYAQPTYTILRSGTLRLPTPHEGQRMILANENRFRVVACGRRFGKTELGKLEVLKTLENSSNAVVWWVSPTYKMALDVWRSFAHYLAPQAEQVDRSHHNIYLPNNNLLAVRSGHDPEKLRGVGLDFLVIDEAAFCQEYVWQVLRPALADRQGKALFLSTPRGRNWFWQLYGKGIDELEPDWAAWRLPTSANVLMPASEIEAAQRDMPERMFLQEFMAEFLEDYGVVFRGVLECVKKERLAWRGHEPVVIGLDWGRANDFTVAIVMGKESRKVLHIDRFNQVKWSVQRDRIRQLNELWKPKMILAEANSIGSPNIEALVAQGLPVRPYHTTSASKATLIDKLALAIEEKSIQLPDDPILIHELQSYEMELTREGVYRFSAPPNGHDDCVIALALALHAATMMVTATIWRSGEGNRR